MVSRIASVTSQVRFGVILLPYSVSFQTVLNATKHAESLGFDSVWISDHIQRDRTPTLECWSTISALSASTSRIRIGSLATCNSFRNPALLAKMVATASVISRGRVDLGIGIGYDEKEHSAGGFSFSNIRQRAEQLAETLKIIQLLWSQERSTYKGKYWKVEDAVCEPKPAGLPRIWVAGRNKHVLEAAASMSVYGLNILPYSGVMEKRKISTFEEIHSISRAIEAAGVHHRSMYCGDGGTIVGADESDFHRRIRQVAEVQGTAAAELERKMSNLSIVYGTLDRCREAIEKLASLEFEELMFIFPGWQHGHFESMNTFAQEFL